MNHGERICLRLRHARDQRQFLPFEQIIDTMLHELCHIVYGPHDANFNALWDQLRSEYEGLKRKGYTGEGFLSEGRRLGGRIIDPIFEAREIARKATEGLGKRRNQISGSSSWPQSFSMPILTDIRDVVFDAIQKRITVQNGCRFGSQNQREIEELATQATKNGFSSQAEEDEANDRAISQALWELVQEDMMREKRNTKSLTKTPQKISFQDSGRSTLESKLGSDWDCPFCTLCNPVNYLACGACNKERTARITRRIAVEQNT